MSLEKNASKNSKLLSAHHILYTTTPFERENEREREREKERERERKRERERERDRERANTDNI